LKHLHDFDKLVAKIADIEKGFFHMVNTIGKELKSLVHSIKSILTASADALADLADMGEIGSIFESLSGVVEEILKVLDVSAFAPIKKIITTIKLAASGAIDDAVKAVTDCVESVENDIIGELTIKAKPAKDAVSSGLASAPSQVKDAIVGLVESFIDLPENAAEKFKTVFAAAVKEVKDGEAIKKLHHAFVSAGGAAYNGMKDGLVNAISKALTKLTQGLIVPKVLSLVIPPVKEGIAPLSDEIPEAVKAFIDPVDLLIEFITEQIELVVETILGPFQKMIADILAKIASSVTGKKEEKKP